MSEAQLDPETLELQRIETEADAESAAFPGSPTIRVDGVDVEPGSGDEPTGLLCRVYRRPDGRVSPLPDPDRVRAALAGARRSE